MYIGLNFIQDWENADNIALGFVTPTLMCLPSRPPLCTAWPVITVTESETRTKLVLPFIHSKARVRESKRKTILNIQ